MGRRYEPFRNEPVHFLLPAVRCVDADLIETYSRRALNPAVISLIVATESIPGPAAAFFMSKISGQVGMLLKRPSDLTGRFRTTPGLAIVAATTSRSVLSLAAPWWLSAPSAPRGGAAAPADLGAAAALDDLPVPCGNSKFRRYDLRIIALKFRILRYSCPSPALPFLEFFVTFPEFSVTNFKFFVAVFGTNPYSMAFPRPQ